MGLPPVYEKGGQKDEHPGEPFDGGCPGGWYRCTFAVSLHRYMRIGERENHLLVRCDDDLVHEAIAYYEGQVAHAGERWKSLGG